MTQRLRELIVDTINYLKNEEKIYREQAPKLESMMGFLTASAKADQYQTLHELLQEELELNQGEEE